MVSREEVETFLEPSLYIIYFFTVLIATLLGLLAFGAIEIQGFFSRAIAYYAIGIVSLLGLVALMVIRSGVLRGSLNEKWFGWARVYLHNPLEGILADVPYIGKYVTFENIFHFAIIFGLSAALFSTVTETFFTGLPAVEQQATPGGKILLETEPAVTGETAITAGLFSLVYGLILWLLSLMNIEERNGKYIALIIGSIATVIFWVNFHEHRYGFEEASLQSTLVFAVTSSFLRMLTGSFIPEQAWHTFSNAFQKSIELFSNETVIAVIIGILILYILFVVVFKLYVKPWFKSKFGAPYAGADSFSP